MGYRLFLLPCQVLVAVVVVVVTCLFPQRLPLSQTFVAEVDLPANLFFEGWVEESAVDFSYINC